MHSPGHRSNLLNPQVDRVGIAVVAARGVLYATADYARGVRALTQTQVEARVAGLIRPSGLTIMTDNSQARESCGVDPGVAGCARFAAAGVHYALAGFGDGSVAPAVDGEVDVTRISSGRGGELSGTGH